MSNLSKKKERMWFIYYFIKLGGLGYLFPNKTRKTVLAGSGGNDDNVWVAVREQSLGFGLQ